MIPAILLVFLALVVAFRALAAVRESTDRIKTLEARLQAIERDLAGPTGASAGPPPSASFATEPPPPAFTAEAPPDHLTRGAASPTVRTDALEADATTLEAEIGSRWMLVAGVVVLVLGVAFFVKYAFDRHWIDEAARVAIGSGAGVLVFAAGLGAVRRGYAPFGRMIAGGGLAILFVSAWAAASLYALVPAAIGFAWIAAVAVLAIVTADRERSIGLALMAVAFAYGAPLLLRTAADHHVVLFVYETILALAALSLVRRHQWPALGVASGLATWATVGVWMMRFYQPSLFASTEAYLLAVSLVFAVMIGVFRQYPESRRATFAAYILYGGPVIFHAASVYVLFEHAPWLLAYFIAGTAAGVVAGTQSAALRLFVWCAAAWPFLVWIDGHGTAAAWFVPAAVTVVALYVIHLVPSIDALRTGTRPAIPELVLFQCNGLGAFVFAYLLFDAHAYSTPLLAAAMAAWYLALAAAFRSNAAPAVAHALASAFTLAAIAISLALTGPWVTAGYAAEGAAVVIVGVRARLGFFRLAGLMLIAFALLRLVALQFGETPAAFTPLLNSRSLTGGFIVALLYIVAWQYPRHRVAFGDEARRAAATSIVLANVLTLGLLTADVNSYWTARPDQVTAGFSKQLSVSVTWAAYAMAVIWVGFTRSSATLRYLALTLFAATVVKMFLVDLLALDGIYRITGFLALGLLLLAASFLYQRHRPRTTG